MRRRKNKTKSRAAINIVLLGLIVILYMVVASPDTLSVMGELYKSPVYRGHEKGMIALECAVDWNAAALPDMLAVLNERGVKITFFVSGKWAEENAGMLQTIAQAGHEIGTMGYDTLLDGSVEELRLDMQRSMEAIKKACGVKPLLYYSGQRKPGNSTRAARKLHIEHIVCSIDLLSGRGDAEDILSRALDRPFDGSIILIQPTAEAVQALPDCLAGLTAKGFRVGTVSEAMGKKTQKEVSV